MGLAITILETFATEKKMIINITMGEIPDKILFSFLKWFILRFRTIICLVNNLRKRKENSFRRLNETKIPPLNFNKMGEINGIKKSPTTAIIRESSTLASAIPDHLINILEQ